MTKNSKLYRWDYLQQQNCHANFHDNANIGSKVITEDNPYSQIHGLAYTTNIRSHLIKICVQNTTNRLKSDPNTKQKPHKIIYFVLLCH
jgi:hypothetical protein